LLSVTGTSYQEKAAAYLRAYKSGWFYKAESRISRDLANLSWTLSYEDSEGDNAEEIVAPRTARPSSGSTRSSSSCACRSARTPGRPGDS
jgi:hypothetical protein